MESLESAEGVAGRGLIGDRYADGVGTFSTWPGRGRAVTLIEEEALSSLEDERGVRLSPRESRRNLLVSGQNLADLVGTRFQIGEVVLIGRRPAPPCQHLEELTRPGVLNALVGRGGIRADVEVGGVLRIQEEIVVLGPVPDDPEAASCEATE